ncbi:MAG: haloacid dehalogenase type II [Alphaproteobacteria bacterium]|nr:haloacid dehalogenase type II [Alphaproteobacteria bacterium]
MSTDLASPPKAILFDVFGTCVDWRGGVAREVALAAARLGVAVDAFAFADAWRGRYQPSMEEVRSGRRPWTILDVLHRESLDALLPKFGLGALDAASRADLNRAWHRLDPWPDVVAGLARLKRRYIIAPLSNGNVALLTNMAKRAGIPWDLVLGAETSRAYKPLPAAYLNAAAMLGLDPGEVMLGAAHNGDLAAARAVGLRTAFVPRPTEHGAGQKIDLAASDAWDVVASDFNDLAARLGA